MKGAKGTAGSHLARTILLLGATAGLCFSVGEGLRLTPFPVPARAADAAPDARLNVAASLGSSPHKYGPLDMPAQPQAQKRGKRQTQECECPPSQNTRKQTHALRRDSQVCAPVGFTSILSISEPADRGPPSPSNG